MEQEKQTNNRVSRIEEFLLDPEKTLFELLEEFGGSVEEIRNALSQIDVANLETLKGEDGKTPERGVDYFTDEDLDNIEAFILDRIPVVGEDVPSPKQVNEYIDKQVAKIPRVKGDKGNPGTPGKPGKDGSPDSAIDILKKIRSLDKNQGLQLNDVRGLSKKIALLNEVSDEFTQLKEDLNKIKIFSSGGGSGLTQDDIGDGATYVRTENNFTDDLLSKLTGLQTSYSFLNLTDTPSDYTGQAGKFVKVNATNDGLEFASVGGGDMLASVYDQAGGAKQVAFASELHNAVTVTDSTEIEFTLTGQDITASIKNGSIDETKLDTSVNNSLDLADTAIQTETDPLSLHLDQTTPQTFTGGDVVGSGLLKVTSGELGLDSTTYVSGTPWTSEGYLTDISGQDLSIADNSTSAFITLGDIPAETDPVVGAITGIVKANGAGTISAANAGTDYQAPLTADTDYLTPGTAASTYQPTGSYLTEVEGTDILSTGEIGGTKYLREDGDGTCSWQTIVGGGTVTAVSVATANGVSGTSSGGATPALTIALGDITPTTVNGLVLSENAKKNIFVGSNSGLNFPTTVYNNNFFGSDSGKGGVVTSASQYNNAFGSSSLYSITSGLGNTGMGHQVLNYVTSGNYNNAFGDRALIQTSTGSNNTGIGYESLYSNSTGSNNIGIGHYAGRYEKGSNSFYVDSRDRTNTAGDKAGAILYGVMSDTPSSQTLKTNSAFTATYGMNIPTGQTYKINGSALTYSDVGAAPAGTYLTSANIEDNITDGHTTIAPSGNAVFDALALKANLDSPSFTTPSLGVATATSINGATITSGTLNGSVTGTNTGDQDLSSYLTSATAASTYQPIGSYLTDITGEDLGDLSNVTEATPADNDLLVYVTDHWENQTLSEAGIQPAGTYLTSANIEDSIVDGHTTIAPSGNAVFDALALKAPLTAPTFGTSITGSYLTASEILITDASKNIVSAPVATYPSLTELSYVKGVTSAIQTQLGDKAPLASPTFTGTVTLADNARVDLTLPTADTYCTGNTTDSFASGYSSAVGDLVFFGSGGKWLEVDADAVATCNGLIGIALEAKNDTEIMKVALPGSFVRLDAWNWTVGATLYAGETLGAMQETIPTGADAIIKVVGFAVSADVIFFNPSPDQQSTVA